MSTKATGALIAALAATSLAACGSSLGPTPVQVGERWYRAEAHGDGSELCKLERCRRTKNASSKSLSTCRAAVT